MAPARPRMIRLIVGTLEPDAGRVRRGTNLQVAYFDQLREQLDPEKTLAETVSPGSDWVRDRRDTANTSPATCGISCFDAGAPMRRSACCPAASAIACCWRGCSRGRRTCWCSTSPPTISTSIRSSCSRTMLQDYTGHAAAGEPRSRLSRQRGHADHRRRGRWALARVRGRLQRLAAAAVAGARAAYGAPRGVAAPPAAPAAPKRKLSYKEQRELESLPGEHREAGERAARADAADLRAGLPSRRRRADAPRPRARQPSSRR